jgi:hypothetical protein
VKHKTRDREVIGDAIARAIAPLEWAEYDEGNGTCSNMAGWACIESIKAAARVMTALRKLGFDIPAKKRKPRSPK